jgi:hypothetical protein
MRFGRIGIRQCYLYIDFLDYFSLVIGLMAVLFFRKVFFHNALHRFQSAKARKRLKQAGIHWISFTEVPLKDYCETFRLNVVHAEKAFKELIEPTGMYTFAVEHFHLDAAGIEKLKAALMRRVTARWVSEGTSSLVLIDYFFGSTDCRVCYVPASINNYLVAQTDPKPWLKPVSIHCIWLEFKHAVRSPLRRIYRMSVSGLYRPLKKMLQGNPSAIPKKAKQVNGERLDEQSLNKYQIAYFPHKSMRYGNFFNKTYLYDSDLQSPLYKEHVLTLFNGPIEPLCARFLRVHRIPSANIKQLRHIGAKYPKIPFGAVLKAWQTKGSRPFLSLANLLAHIFVLKFLRHVETSLDALSSLKALKVTYFHYDILVPDHFLVACHIRSIKTVSNQERTQNYSWNQYLLFDHYCVGGEGFRSEFKKRGYAIREYHVVGLPRSGCIKHPVSRSRYKRLSEIRKHFKLVVCFDIPPYSDFQVGLMGKMFTMTGILEFYHTLIRLAMEFSDLYFAVKPKSTEMFSKPPFVRLQKSIDTMQNMCILNDIQRYNPYVTSYFADLILGIPTSILDEAFAFGKKVIYYDNEGFLKHTDSFLGRVDIVERDYEGLRRRIAEVINGGQYLNPQAHRQFIKKYLGASVNGGFKGISDYVVQLLECHEA